jgi:hypothetical protein
MKKIAKAPVQKAMDREKSMVMMMIVMRLESKNNMMVVMNAGVIMIYVRVMILS